jgi:hypothetical protein
MTPTSSSAVVPIPAGPRTFALARLASQDATPSRLPRCSLADLQTMLKCSLAPMKAESC